MSATMGAGGVAFLYLSILAVTRSRIASAFAALFFAFSTTFWSQTGIAEVYAPNIFMVALMLFLLIRWSQETQKTEPSESSLAARLYFWGFCLTFGLSLGTHMSNLALAPGIVVYILLVNWRILKQPLLVVGGLSMFVLGCLQFLWLPLRAASFEGGLVGPDSPTTLNGFLNYTVNAFPQFKFAFPLSAIPQRIGIYLELLHDNFGIFGMLLALAGMWAMLFRQTRLFFFLIVMYLVHVAFFVQYRAFDIEVFFIPAHFIMAVFIGFGVWFIMQYVSRLLSRIHIPNKAVMTGMALLLVIPVSFQATTGYAENNYSKNTVINDFYANVFKSLPYNSVLIGPGQVFGYDMFYFRYVYNVRPDVLMPMAEPRQRIHIRELKGRAVFTNQRPNRRAMGPWAVPPGLLDEQAWYVPILAAPTEAGIGWRGRPLTLYEITRTPPSLIVAEVNPGRMLNARLGPIELVGYDLGSTEVRRGSTIQLVYYWRVHNPGLFPIVTTVGNSPFREVHELGFGNLERYVREFKPPRDGVVVEKYNLVIPSSTEPGEHMLKVGLARLEPSQQQDYLELEKIKVME